MNYPLVSVVTPFYNSEDFLADCIESVIRQSYENLEYILMDNCSTDRSGKIADRYADNDSRVRVIHASDFMEQRQNYNRAVGAISSDSKYCKVVEADNTITCDCIERMVQTAERNPSVGLVGAYYCYGDIVAGSGIPYHKEIVPGREACRIHLLNPGKSIFGAPTAVMYRASLVREADKFYDEISLDEDTDICYQILRDWDFGFVHQVLSYLRKDEATLAEIRRKKYPYSLDMLILFFKYGETTLDDADRSQAYKWLFSRYASDALDLIEVFGVRKIWIPHKRAFAEAGVTLSVRDLVLHIGLRLIDYVFNPKKTIWRFVNRNRHARN